MIDGLKTQKEKQLDYGVSLLQTLVRTPSITGEESAVQAVLKKELEALHLEVEEWNPAQSELKHHPAYSDDGLPLGQRPCLVARWKGAGDGQSLILNGHVDVVPPGDPNAWTEEPWSGIVRDGKLYGRGSCDMKGGIVAGLLAVRMLKELGIQPRGDVLLEFVIGEETGGVGTLATLLKGYTADAAILLEPTELKLCPVGSGAASFRLHVQGRAAHGSMRMEGVSAIEKFAVLHKAIMDFETERHRTFRHPLYNDGLAAPISVGKLQAGDWPSSVPDLLVAEGRYGVFPDEPISEARTKFQEAVANASNADEWLRICPPKIEWFEGQFESASTPLESKLLSLLQKTHHEVTGNETSMRGVPYGSDLRFFTNYARIPAVLYGPGSVLQAHSANEFISIEEMMLAAQIVARTIATWCGI